MSPGCVSAAVLVLAAGLATGSPLTVTSPGDSAGTTPGVRSAGPVGIVVASYSETFAVPDGYSQKDPYVWGGRVPPLTAISQPDDLLRSVPEADPAISAVPEPATVLLLGVGLAFFRVRKS